MVEYIKHPIALFCAQGKVIVNVFVAGWSSPYNIWQLVFGICKPNFVGLRPDIQYYLSLSLMHSTCACTHSHSHACINTHSELFIEDKA